MRPFLLAIVLLLAPLPPMASAQQTGKWGDQGDGTFRNPVIAADFSDPDPLRVGEDYYLVSSTFESSPGVSVLHSKDLVNWSLLGGIFTDLSKVDKAFSAQAMARYSRGVYAPSLRYHDGKFWVFVNFYTDGFWVATAKHPAGPWELQQIKDKNGQPLRTSGWTDPCPFWDDDGKAYLATSRPGSKWYSYLFQMAPDGTTLLDADFEHMKTANIAYDFAKGGGTCISPNQSSEGNKIYKRNGFYYLLHIEFLQTGQGAGTYIYRSKNIFGTKADGSPGGPGDLGTYEVRRMDAPARPDYQQEIPGQGGLVDTPDGRWFWIAQFNRYGSDGRTPCLLPVTWIDDWPVVGTNIENGFGKTPWQLPKPIPSSAMVLPQQSDDFASPTLAPFWAWNHQPEADKWSLKENPGSLRLYAMPTRDKSDNFFNVANTINQRHMRSDSTVITVKLDLSHMATGQKAGLAHFNSGKNYAYLAVSVEGKEKQLIYVTNGKMTQGPSLGDGQKEIHLKSRAGFDDQLTYQYSTDGQSFKDVGGVYKMVPANYRGDMIGLFTYNNREDAGFIDVDWFKYDVTHY